MSYELEYCAEDADVTVEFEFTAGCRGARENGVPIEPDSPAEIEILSVTDCEGDDYELTEAETEEVIEKAEQYVYDAAEDAKAEAQIAAWEARNERW